MANNCEDAYRCKVCGTFGQGDQFREFHNNTPESDLGLIAGEVFRDAHRSDLVGYVIEQPREGFDASHQRKYYARAYSVDLKGEELGLPPLRNEAWYTGEVSVGTLSEMTVDEFELFMISWRKSFKREFVIDEKHELKDVKYRRGVLNKSQAQE